ncbi:MAG: hypothetical protein ABMB14_23075 [Myxococcota bacterium]
MNRMWIGALAVIGCHGGSDDDDDDDDDVILSTVDADFDVTGDLVDDTCDDDDVQTVFEEADIRVSQVADGMSVFVDADVGWVPCAGSIVRFDCRWGNAPGDRPTQVWSWRLAGTTDEDGVHAELSLTVTCDEATTNDCDECSVLATFEGELDG